MSPEIQALLGLEQAAATPQEVMTAILKMNVDLLWFGGIGTYIRATTETDADAGDRANDPIRITAPEVGAKVIGEGANLGLTQLARIEFNKNGGQCNSDAIDNSAGVNSSDMEVNIKIALGAAVKSGKLTLEQRNALLAEMTDEGRRSGPAEQLSADTRHFDDAAARAGGFRLPGSHDAPARTGGSARPRCRAASRRSHACAKCARRDSCSPRAELGVLLAYAKLTLYDALLDSSVPDDAYLARELFRYFPEQMATTYQDEINGHRLRREIIATMLANSMINRGGATFLTRLMDQTGATPTEIAQGFVAVRNSFDLTDLNTEIDALDTRIDGCLQLDLYTEVQSLLLERVVWFKSATFSSTRVCRRSSTGSETALPTCANAWKASCRRNLRNFSTPRAAEFEERGVPKSLARRNRLAHRGAGHPRHRHRIGGNGCRTRHGSRGLLSGGAPLQDRQHARTGEWP